MIVTKGEIIKIWWDGTIEIQWETGKKSTCNISDVVIVKWKKKNIIVKMKTS